MKNSLDEIPVDSIHTNIPLPRRLVRDQGFCAGGINIYYLEHKLSQGQD